MFRDPNVTYNTDNAPKLLFLADSNFVLIAKAGNVITLYYSLEGHNWFLIRHLTFDSTQPLKLGFLAQSPTGQHCTVYCLRIFTTRRRRSPTLTRENESLKTSSSYLT
ncbi:MAG TPA: DUF1349 domain-containing protein [Puia sp.]|jgi:hypothetical protein|nr:DUF1349 domain-containing protein [Puia sp.]